MVTAAITLVVAGLLGVSTASTVSTTVSDVINPFNMPGPVITSIAAPSIDICKSIDCVRGPEVVKTTAAFASVEKPGPVSISITGHVSSHVSDKSHETKPGEVMSVVNTIVAPAIDTSNLDAPIPTTLITKSIYLMDKPLMVFTPPPDHAWTKTTKEKEARTIPVITKITVNPATATAEAPPSFGPPHVRREQVSNNNDNVSHLSISPTTIGWIVAIIFGVLMTVACVILLHCKMGDRRRNRAAKRVQFREI